MRVVSSLFILCLLAPGCLTPGNHATDSMATTGTGQTQPCAPNYYDGCDKNPDAKRMLNEFGLHQITNISKAPWPERPSIDAGLIAWSQLYEGYTRETQHAFMIPPRTHGSFEDIGAEALMPKDGVVAYARTPILDLGGPNQTGDRGNSTVWIWKPADGARRQIESIPKGNYGTVHGRSGFDGKWLLLILRPEHPTGYQYGAMAVNVEDGRSTALFNVTPADLAFYPTYGTPLLFRQLSNGSVFLSYFYEKPFPSFSTIVETKLDTGEEITHLRVNRTVIDYFDASDEYLVVPTAINKVPGIWVMSRENGTWWNLQKDPRFEGIQPVVGGDWAIYYETGAHGTSWIGGIVGIHIPTGKRYELLQDGDDVSFANWDTDGKYLVTQVGLCYSSFNCAYPESTQLYWMELPKP